MTLRYCIRVWAGLAAAAALVATFLAMPRGMQGPIIIFVVAHYIWKSAEVKP
jgi:hypothetical protein